MKQCISFGYLALTASLWSFAVTAAHGVSVASASDPLTDEYRRTQPGHRFASPVYMLPSQMRYASESDYVRVGFGFEQRKEEQPVVLQQGNGFRKGTVKVENFTRLKNNALAWGGAYYTNGLKQNPVWNETSDYRLLYPYVAGDSIGGNMLGEEYAFSGGYRQHLVNRLSLAATLNYRGLLEYRDRDPRPKNITNDIRASLGAACLVAGRWSLGLDLRVRRYKQTALIKFFSELGASPVYHFVGLGRDYARFFGDKTSYYYDGNGAGASLSLYDTTKQGFSLAAGYDFLHIRKILLSLNKLPMTDLAQHAFTLNARYRYRYNGKLRIGIGADAHLHQKTGTENLFGDPVHNEYRVLTTTTQFYAHHYALTMTAFAEYHFSPHAYVYARPSLTLERLAERYIFPRRAQGKSVRTASLPVGTTYTTDKWLFRIAIRPFYAQAVAPKFIFADAESDTRFVPFVKHNYRYFYSSVEGISADATAYYAINKRFSFFVNASWEANRYKAAPNVVQFFTVKCGVLL